MIFYLIFIIFITDLNEMITDLNEMITDLNEMTNLNEMRNPD